MNHCTGKTAADFVNREVADWVATDIGDSRGPGEDSLWWILGCEYREGPDLTYIVLYDIMRDWLAHEAEHDSEARRLFTRIVSSRLMAGIPLQRSEGRIAAQLINGTIVPLPKRRGKKLATNHERDVFIISLLLEVIERFDIVATRNDATAERSSACDLVANAFAASNRHEVTFRAVKEIWNNTALRRRYHELAKIVHKELARRKVAQESPVNALAPSFRWDLLKT